MIIALWLIWMTDANSGAVYIGNFPTMAGCEQAAQQAKHVGRPPTRLIRSFASKQNK